MADQHPPAPDRVRERIAVQVTLWDWPDDTATSRVGGDGAVAESALADGVLPTEPVLAEALAVVERSVVELAQVETRPVLDPPAPRYRLRRIGDSDLHAFPVVLSGGTFGWTVGAESVPAVLDAYVESGGNAVDTAPGYSAGRSEILVGEWIRDRGNRDEIVLFSKTAKADGAGPSPLASQRLVAGVESTLTRLGTDRLDVLCFDDDDQTVPLEETLTAAESLVRSGKVRYLAARGYSPERLMEARVIAGQLGLPRFVATQVDYSLLAREHFEGAISTVARAQGLAVLPVRALGSGFLTGKHRARRADRGSVAAARSADVAPHLGKRGFRILGALDAVAADHGVAPATVALAWLLTKPLVTSPVVTVSAPEQVADLVAAARVHLTRAQVAALDKASAA